jgi:MFS family permease
MSEDVDRLFTPRFFVMCGFTFTVFLSALQLLPTAPFHILDLGGSTFASGMFLGFLTYSSAFSAPFTGAVADRVGRRRILITSSLALAVFSLGYAVMTDYRWMLATVLVHGVFWSGLLSASSAYMTSLIPERRRAEGLGYWGLSSVAAVAVAPPVGFWIYGHGWLTLCLVGAALNLTMALIAWRLRDTPLPVSTGNRGGRILEWRVLAISGCLFLYSFGYGGITSFTSLYADAHHITPKSIYLTTLALAILTIRPMAGRLGDRLGYHRVFVPCLLLISAGLVLLAVSSTKAWLIVSAIVFGAGFGTAYPVYVGYIMKDVSADRRGAAFGAILAAFDTGIGTGSTTMGWIIGHHGYAAAFGTAAALSSLALPYFLVCDRLLHPRHASSRAGGGHGSRTERAGTRI